MQKKRFKFLLAVLLLLGGILAAGRLSYGGQAQGRGGGYDLSWYTFDGGGTTSGSGGAYGLGGTIGQADAGQGSGGSLALEGGFWHSAPPEPPDYDVYLPLIRNGS